MHSTVRGLEEKLNERKLQQCKNKRCNIKILQFAPAASNFCMGCGNNKRAPKNRRRMQ
jgi:hypothetical protein